MKRRIALALVAGLAAAVVTTVFIAKRGATSAQAQAVTFAFTADVRGRLVPCGCFTGQFGGLTRIATLFGERTPSETIKVDVGDAIEGGEDYDRIQYRYLLEAFAKMGYEAINLGHREAALTAAQLQELRSASPVPMISANLIDTAKGTPLFEGYRIVQRGPWRIALIGVMDSHVPAESLGDGLAVERIDTTLGRLLPTLKDKADFIVLLAFTDEETLANLAREFYELNVILGGKVAQPSQQLAMVNRSLILSVTNESRAVGFLEVNLDVPGKMTPVKGDVRLVHDRIAQDKAIRELADAYRHEVRGTKLDVDDPESAQAGIVPGVKKAANYSGSETCLGCHASAGRVWAGSGHAQAYATLIAAKAEADPKCLGCHTVGFRTPSGYMREFGDGKLTNVGCESCHGPGSRHVEQRLSGAEAPAHFRPLGAGDCQTCHHGEFSRPFEWDKFWPAIRHGKESGVPAGAAR